jgi:hypothetical protein
MLGAGGGGPHETSRDVNAPGAEWPEGASEDGELTPSDMGGLALFDVLQGTPPTSSGDQ